MWKGIMKSYMFLIDVLEASAARYQMLPKKDSERKTMSESEVNERETFTHW
jgi:hypothetical protein